MKNFKKYFLTLNIIFFVFFIFKYDFNNSNSLFETKVYFSCDCQDNQILRIIKVNESYEIHSGDKCYTLNSSVTLTCNLGKSLRRGPNQKIISYSLYGNNSRYYNLIEDTILKAKQFYPDYILRIYHDDSIDKSIICKNECLNPHVEFCNIHQMPLSLTDTKKVVDFKYIHSMIWRFLPIGDSLVDIFMSRDLDSLLLQREVDSVQEWLQSENVGHIMRDNPAHGTHILGGMWSFRVDKGRELGKKIYKKIIDKTTSSKYNPNKKSPKGYDQFFLSHHLYNEIKDNSTIHDSYLCKKYPKSEPWPTQRKGDCFVGRVGKCRENATFKICPNECRPKNHLDWNSC